MKQKKYFIIVFFIILLFPYENKLTFAQETFDGDEDNIMMEGVSFEQIQKHWTQLSEDYGGFLPEIQKTSLTELIKRTDSFSFRQIMLGFVKFLLYELVLNGKLLGSLLILTLFSIVLQTMQSAFEQSSVSKIAYFVVYIVLIFIILNSFYLTFTYAKDAIDAMSSFMIALIPLILGLIATFGSIATVSFFHPVIIFLINVSGLLVSKLILPLLFLSALLIIVSSLNENYQVTHMAHLLKTISVAILGVFLTIFIGIMSLQGTVSAIQDGVAMKTAKFVTGNFIPVIGKTFTDAADTVLSASLLLKNGVGITGVIIILLFALFPALKIFAIALIYKLAAAMLQPIGDGPVITSLNTISKYIVYVLACLLAVTLMFFLSIVIIVAASNLTVLLR